MTNDPRKAEFDEYADAYTDLVRTGIRVSGEEPAFFAAMKAHYMAMRLGDEVSSGPLDILDFGCGIGNSVPHLHKSFPLARLHGVDPSSESIQIASGAYPAAKFSINTERAVPYPDRSFDLIQVACVFHHISPPQRSHWMAEMRRVLKPSGHIFIFEHNVLNPVTTWAVRNSPVDRDAVLLPKHELLALARESGLNQISSQYIVFFPNILAWLRPLEPLIGWLPFGAQYAVHATA